MVDDEPAGPPVATPSGITAPAETAPTLVGLVEAGEVADERPLPVIDRGQYRIEREIARGGQGRIFTARDLRLGRRVAVKEALERDPAHLIRFDREARLTARLQHPGIVSVYEAGKWPSGEPFYAMRLIDGRPLSKVIAETTTLAQRLALVPHVLEVANALAYAHAQRIIHRDLKPANILVGTYGEVVVIDWGLAKHLDDHAPDPVPAATAVADGELSITMLGAVLGTPAYMPVEQATGKPVDERVDVYAIGAILYEVLAGRPPLKGTALGVIEQLVARPPPALTDLEPHVPDDLAAIVAHAMARDATARYRTAKELADDLGRFLTGQLVASRHYTRGELVRRWLRRYRTTLAIVGVALAMVVGVAATSYWQVVAERDIANTARLAERHRNDELRLIQARTALATDPTAAVAWLLQLAVDSPSFRAASLIADVAAARGVAHLVPLPSPALVVEPMPDGDRLVVGDAAHDLAIVAPLTGARVAIGRLGGEPRAIAVDAAGAYAIVGTDTGSEVWQLAPAKRLTVHAEPGAVAISADGARVAYRSGTHQTALCDRGDAHCSHVAASPDRAIALLADGHVVVAQAERITIADASGAVIGEHADPRRDVRAGVAVDAARRRFAYAGTHAEGISIVEDGAVRVGAVACDEGHIGLTPDGDGTVCARPGVGVDVDRPGHAHVHLDGDFDTWAFAPTDLAAFAGGGTIWLTQLDGTRHWRLDGHHARALAFVARGTRLVSVGDDGSLRVWPVDPHLHPGFDERRADPATTAVLSTDGRALLAARAHAVRAVLADGTTATLDAPGADAPLLSSASSDDEVVIVGQSGTWRQWRPRTGEVRNVEADDQSLGIAATRRLVERDGRYVVIDTATDQPVWSIPAAGRPITSDAFDVAVETTSTGISVMTAVGARAIELGVDPRITALSPSGRWLAARADSSSRLCDLSVNRCRTIHTGRHQTAAFTRDDRHYVALADDGLEVVDVATGEVTALVRHHAFTSPPVVAGDLLVGAGDDAVVLHDLVSGEEHGYPLGDAPQQIAVHDDVVTVLVPGPAVIDLHPTMPHDMSLLGVLAGLTNARVDQRGALVAR